jgi:hypothetical protein
MIALEFDIDESALAEDLESSPESANPAALEETYFLMPVRLTVDGIALLQLRGSTSSALPLPLLSVASFGWERISQLGENEVWTYGLPGGGKLLFTREGDAVTIRSDLNGAVVSTSYAELVREWREFRKRVKDFLAEHVPKLRTHSAWTTWRLDEA